MKPTLDLEKKMTQIRDKRISEQQLIHDIETILSTHKPKQNIIKQTLTKPSKSKQNNFIIKHLDHNRIYHLKDIEKICISYRLRFLNSNYFKGNIPTEALQEIQKLEELHNTKLNGFKIVAPAKLLKLENADDPLLFAPIGNGYYYLIHKWGKDLHYLRKWLMWPLKRVENLIFSLFIISVVFTLCIPIHLLAEGIGAQEYLAFWLFNFQWIIGLTIFYGVSFGKNFSSNNWESKFYNA